jgi:arylsulfatase A-like enzyme
VREGDWKLIVTRETGKAELFQLAEDPNEEKDLADTEPDRVRTLRDLMRDLAARDNDARATDE